MTGIKPENVDELEKAVERTCECKATYFDQIAIIEKYGSHTAWEGIVHIFRITGNPKTDTCYAWSSPIEGTTKRRYYTVLKVPPIDTPEKAVRAAIVSDYKNKEKSTRAKNEGS